MPLPLPPTSSGDGAALLWSFSVPLFCEPPAVCSGRLILPSLSHSLKKSPSDCSQGLRASPCPKECRRLLSVPPPLAGGGCGRLGVLFCWELLLARNLWALFNFSSQLGCPPRSENLPQTRQRKGFLVVGNFLYWDSLPGTGLRPSFSCVPFLIFNIFVLPPFEDNGLLFWAPDVLC